MVVHDIGPTSPSGEMFQRQLLRDLVPTSTDVFLIYFQIYYKQSKSREGRPKGTLTTISSPESNWCSHKVTPSNSSQLSAMASVYSFHILLKLVFLSHTSITPSLS